MDVGTKRVSVAVRVRPVLRNGVSHMHAQEKFELIAVHPIGDTGVQVQEQKQDEACRSSVFQFDHIFDQESTQLEVYEEAVVDLIDGALAGVNATILAYGQTGSGKTHTVLGDVKPNPLENDLLTAQSGLFLRVLSDLIEYKKRRRDKMHVTIGLSCVEIYNENIRDLFGGDAANPPPQLKVVMTDEAVYMPSLIVKEVTSLQSVFSEIQLAIGRRASRSTESNASSSRSHCLFMIDILQCPSSAPPPSVTLVNQQPSSSSSSSGGSGGAGAKTGAGMTRTKSNLTTPTTTATGSRSATPTPSASPLAADGSTGFQGQILRVPGQQEPVWSSKILLADLAGSEKIRNSGVVGKGLEEATSINSSLTALGNVVHSLYEGGFVSYRVSKLTQLLKPAFSQPSSRVLLLAQVSPTQLTFDETISTLHFANKVKDMKVQTTTGTETEKLQFEVIEAEKQHDAVLADLHIWMAESECRPVIRRNGFVSGLYYEARANAPYKVKDRQALLHGAGAVAIAQKEKEARARAREEETARMAREKTDKIRHMAGELVKEHDEAVEDLQASIADVRADILSGGSQLVTLESTNGRVQISLAEEAARLALAAQFYTTGVAIVNSDIESVSTELERLSRMKVEASPVDAELALAIRNDDERYGCAAWAHCSAKRFFARYQELREAHIVLLRTKRHVAQLEAWSKQALAVVKEREQKAAASAAGGGGHVDPAA